MASMRLAIAEGIVAMLQGIQNPNTSQPLYQYVKLGHMSDPSQFSGLWADVAYVQGKSGPAGSGGNLIGWRIEDNPIFAIQTGADYEADSTAAMTNVLTAMDILLPVIHSHYQIPAPGNPTQPIASVYSLLVEGPNDRALPLRYPNGKVYYIWATYITTKQQFNVNLVNP